MQLWDTAGQLRFRSLIPSYIRDSDCIVVVVSAVGTQLYHADLHFGESAMPWVEMTQKVLGEQIPLFLCCNKIDLCK